MNARRSASPARWTGVASVVCGMALTTAASASGVDDGEAGLKALDRGAYGEAVRLFTKALDAGDLAPDDREFAFFNRGKAYLAEGDRTRALADLRQAVRLKPDDAEAQDALHQALAPATATSASSEKAHPSSHDHWGVLRSMAGKYYWYEISGGKSHVAYFHVEWTTPEQTIATSLQSKAGVAAVGEFQFDEGSGKLLGAGVEGSDNTVSYGIAEASATGLSDYTYFKTTPIHDVLALQPDGSIKEHEQKFQNGSWRDAGDVTLVETSADALQAAGLLKKK
jgi:tetratricopeptide (TPR) repeat protein